MAYAFAEAATVIHTDPSHPQHHFSSPTPNYCTAARFIALALTFI
jgi:hypothetical protein